MRVCPECGARYEDDAAFCPMDGSPLGEPMSPSVPAPAGGPVFVAANPEEPEKQEEPLLGLILGDRYRVDERIGAGGMGLVYKATHVLIGRKLAIKVLRSRYARQPELAQRFAQEARVASSVKHPNVVDIIDYGTTPHGSPYCVMELLAGHSLAREIVERGPLEPRRALAVAIHIARGLAAAHQAGVIHRDLKPDNVFLVPADAQAPEQVKILDFGIARVAGSKIRLTAAGSVVGTPEYMSPEQARGDDLDVRSDLYALGVLLFEALTGQVPLSGDSLAGTLTKQVFEHAPPIRTIDPRFAEHPNIEAALSYLLAKDREGRPQSALAAACMLQNAAAEDLGPIEDPVEAVALASWSASHPVAAEADRPRRSTIVIGSGAITRAHETVEADGPATGSFAAKQGPETPVQKRPSVIVDGPGAQFRPARILPAAADSMAAPRPPPEPVSRTPTPMNVDRRRLGKPPSGHLRRRHLPLILVGLGAAIFAALVTIGFIRWWQRREARRANVTGMMKGSPLDRRYEARGAAIELDKPLAEARAQVRPEPCRAFWGPNTLACGPVEGPARMSEHDHTGTPPWRKCGTLGRPPNREVTYG